MLKIPLPNNSQVGLKLFKSGFYVQLRRGYESWRHFSIRAHRSERKLKESRTQVRRYTITATRWGSAFGAKSSTRGWVFNLDHLLGDPAEMRRVKTRRSGHLTSPAKRVAIGAGCATCGSRDLRRVYEEREAGPYLIALACRECEALTQIDRTVT